MKKILVFVDSFTYGGVTSLIRDIYRKLDNSKYSVDFVRHTGEKYDFDDEIICDGNKVFYIEDERLNSIPALNYTMRKRNMIRKVVSAIGKGHYDTAYIHANADYCVPAAKALGIKNIIMHSHEAVGDFKGNENKSKVTAFIWKKRVAMYNKLVTHKLGDSLRAIIAKFGEKVVNDPAIMVVHPPINMDKFNPDNYGSGDVFNVNESAFNMIHVGRLSPVKNQSFLIDVLAEILQYTNSHLYIVGEGDEKEKLLDYADKKCVADKVTFLAGNTSPEIYKKMDCSLLPSFSEAFGMVAVESQLMGVPCFASTNVPTDVDAGMCEFIDLEKGAEYWAKQILDYDYDNACIDDEKVKEFDINNIVSRLEEVFDD